MGTDYPAAHSMDTCFFAIDRDGHVACFDTGEAGAVPAVAFSGEEAYELRQQLAELPRVEVLQDPSGCSNPGSAQGTDFHWGLVGSNHPILLFLASLDLVRDEIVAGRAVELPACKGVAVLFQSLPAELSQRLHDSGACLGCRLHYQEIEEFYPDLGTHGLFMYTHLTDNWISGPYGRQSQPARPIHVDQLPPQIREAVKAMRFDSLCFAETPHIQPVEHAECFSWEAAYMDVTGKHIRPIPGKEEEYAQAYEELADLTNKDDNPQVEPPPGHQPQGGEQ
ncbi:MAG TPA: hypothetical protein VH592_01315 [Gemmataceae bacterium]|jgi:hypothetical protein